MRDGQSSISQVAVELVERIVQQLALADDDELEVSILLGQQAEAEKIIALAGAIEAKLEMLPVVRAIEWNPTTNRVSRADPMQLSFHLIHGMFISDNLPMTSPRSTTRRFLRKISLT